MKYQDFKQFKTCPVSPNFADTVLRRFREENVDSFWAIFDVLPHPLIKVGFALSIFIIIAFSLPSFTGQNLELSSTDKLIYYGETQQELSTDAEALSFALYSSSGELK